MRPGVEMRRQAMMLGVAVLAGLVALGILASASTAHPAAGAGAQDDHSEMTYTRNGSPVMLHNTIYTVFWDGGAGFNSGSDESSYEQLVQKFLSNLQGTTYYHILSQYYETNGFGDNKRFIGPYTQYG